MAREISAAHRDRSLLESRTILASLVPLVLAALRAAEPALPASLRGVVQVLTDPDVAGAICTAVVAVMVALKADDRRKGAALRDAIQRATQAAEVIEARQRRRDDLAARLEAGAARRAARPGRQ